MLTSITLRGDKSAHVHVAMAIGRGEFGQRRCLGKVGRRYLGMDGRDLSHVPNPNLVCGQLGPSQLLGFMLPLKETWVKERSDK